MLLVISALLVSSSVAQNCVQRTILPVNQSTYNSAVSALRTTISASLQLNGDAAGDMVGGIVRLAFHDAAGYDQNTNDTFGPDGCFDTSNPDNAGLTQVAASLDPLWMPFCEQISKADFWVLAAKVSIELATPGGSTTIPIRFGRTTASSCSDFTNGLTRLPRAELGVPEITRVFLEGWGITMRQAVALIGAHTLGRADPQNSGYNGPWTNDPEVFNNRYFRDIIEDPWDRTTRTVNMMSLTEWRRGGGGGGGGGPQPPGRFGRHRRQGGPNEIMLNADMEIAYHAVACNFDRTAPINENGPQPQGTCATNDDLVNSPYPHTVEFSENQGSWLLEFRAAFEIMTELGTEGQLMCDPNFGNCVVRQTDFVPLVDGCSACLMRGRRYMSFEEATPEP